MVTSQSEQLNLALSVKKKILFVIGTANQTTQMHQIATHLADEFDCWFSQYYADAKLINWGVGKGWLDHTVLGNPFREASEAYLRKHNLQYDYRATKNQYDLVVTCSDMLLPKAVRNTRSIWLQEGMVDPVTYWSKFVSALRLPRYFSINTSLNGSSNGCDIFCAASEGYKQFFTKMGTDAHRILVTGIPNFDDVEKFRDNSFPHRDYVMVATSDIRETFRAEDRSAFIRKVVTQANGRQLLFKLHPNETYDRAEVEIREYAPANTLIYQQGNTNEMIANCAELITQYSTVVYVGIALGKPVSSYFDVDELRRLTPVQNGGTSAQNVARLCRDFLNFDGPRDQFVKSYTFRPVQKGREYLSL